MKINLFPTKGNLINARNSLALAKQGYELMDRKRNVLIRELMKQMDEAKDLQGQIRKTFSAAYAALQRANLELGIDFVRDIATSVPTEESLSIKTRSIMGTEIPLIRMEEEDITRPAYSLNNTSISLDEARLCFDRVKALTIRLAMVETSAFRLAANIQKTQKRANALKNITIPAYEAAVGSISEALEEKEREDFTRLKVIKRLQEH